MNDPRHTAADPGAELSDFARKLGGGFETLKDLPPLQAGATPRDAVYREDKMTLYRYRPPAAVEPAAAAPLLIVYALVNRPYMMDLDERRSLIRALLEQGLDVYLIDWGYPDRADQCLDLDDYINGYLERCVDVVERRSGAARLNLLGVCQGGAFSLCYAALHRERVANLITMVTPVNFHTPDNLLSHWTREIDIDLLVETLGNVPGELLNWTFLSLKPFQLMGRKYLDMVDALADPQKARNFMLMEKWIFDSPDQAGEAFREFVTMFFQDNGFVNGSARIGGRAVDLRRVDMPVLNIYASEDHLVPPDASRALGGLVGGDDYTELRFAGGHIGIYVSGKSQHSVPPAIAEWLAARS